jgi:chemotaxis protein MotA
MLVVAGCVLGGFVAEKGHLPVILQPVEVMIIFGAAIGSILISALPHQVKGLNARAFRSLGGTAFSPALAKELLTCLFQLAMLVKKEGVIALENHVTDPETSEIFSGYPRLLKSGPLLGFITDSLRLQVDGAVAVEELDVILEQELECRHDEEAAYARMLRTVADALPGLGIVAAVLGVIVTMGAIDGPPAEIGHHVAVALVGTFLGVLCSYGFVGPTAAAMDQELRDSSNVYRALKKGIVAFAEGKSPVVVVEICRRSLYTYNRPDREEIEEACKALRAA